MILVIGVHEPLLQWLTQPEKPTANLSTEKLRIAGIVDDHDFLSNTHNDLTCAGDMNLLTSVERDQVWSMNKMRAEAERYIIPIFCDG